MEDQGYRWGLKNMALKGVPGIQALLFYTKSLRELSEMQYSTENKQTNKQQNKKHMTGDREENVSRM